MDLDLSSPKTIKDILTKYETKPFKGMGQNFLVNRQTLEKIVSSADLKTEDVVLEVGPGLGTLTAELAKSAGRVIAVEKDQKMCEILKETLSGFENIQIINDDILKINSEPYTLNPYKVVANIPYYLTSPLIRKFLETKYPPEFMLLMMQKEVAQRICANPPDMSILAVSVQFYAKAEIISYVKKENFWPKPKVDSAIIKIVPKTSENSISPDLFFKIVKAGFSHPRKQLGNNLLSLGDKEEITSWLLKNKIKPTQRAETLSVEDWTNLLSTACCFQIVL